ncbi:MAG: hypothetical protein PHO37_14620 [Kiritimatiellae bacterium]|nr:hypothetical protein [Kiritimatiellia bacterium]
MKNCHVATLFLACIMLSGGCAGLSRDKVVGSHFSVVTGRPVQLTFGDGNDSEAAWSCDGGRIAFQRELQGDLDVKVLSLADKKITPLVAGAGLACYPAWTLDGAIIYVCSERGETTAVEMHANEMKLGFNLRMLKDGRTSVLTDGLWRDYTPSVSSDGRSLYYASSRDCTGNNSSLWRLSLDNPSDAACIISGGPNSEGFAQPSLSPDGRILLWGEINGLFSNWQICAAFENNTQRSVKLTPPAMSAYAPSWSPDGKFIAFTGFRSGDSAWKIYVMEPRSGEMFALNTGMGNSRTPKWSPDGKSILYENNATGEYKLYRLLIDCSPINVALDNERPQESNGVAFRLKMDNQKAVLVNSEKGSIAGVYSAGVDPSRAAKGTMPVAFEVSEEIDYGQGSFYVQVKFRVDSLAEDTRIVAVGSYKQNSLAWQVFVHPDGTLYFNSRDRDGSFIGVKSIKPLRSGETVTVTGVRDSHGYVRMWVNGVDQNQTQGGAGFDYVEPLKISLGQQFNGGQRLAGEVLEFETGRGWPPGIQPPLTRSMLFNETEN